MESWTRHKAEAQPQRQEEDRGGKGSQGDLTLSQVPWAPPDARPEVEQNLRFFLLVKLGLENLSFSVQGCSGAGWGMASVASVKQGQGT